VADTIKASFMRGGTSKALMFDRADLPADRVDWDPLLLAAMGSPDPYGRQLNGMGGGLSSLSKVCVVGASSHPDADVDFTFAQVQLRQALVDYSGNCGNMSAAIGPFALDLGLVTRADGQASVVVHNTNTAKLVRATFEVREGRACNTGELTIPGVGGTGAGVRLDFLDPGGPATGRLLPTGNPLDRLVTDCGPVTVSMVDAGNACVFVAADELGLTGSETPEELDADADALAAIASIRRHASVAMGLTADVAAAAQRPLTPFIAVLGAARHYITSDGRPVAATDYDLAARFVSNGQPHRAVPGTGALAVAVAARLPGTVAAALAPETGGRGLALGTPAGVVDIDANVVLGPEGWRAESATTFRTFRRLFTGAVFV
jgi:2-methylaconitate cis-trans-isomerase PrpF